MLVLGLVRYPMPAAWPSDLSVRFAVEKLGSILSRAIPKTQKMVFIVAPLNAQCQCEE